MGRVTSRVPVVRIAYADDSPSAPARPDPVAVEEPLEIRAAGSVVTVTMRTPGADIDLVHGYLLAEGLIESGSEITGARYCAGSVASGPDGLPQNTYNVIEVDLAALDPARLVAAERLTTTTSACGVCGSASIDALKAKLPHPLAGLPVALTPERIADLLTALRAGQVIFRSTGGTHAAALFDLDGSLRAHAEDVGRHNAVDKVIGAVVRAGADPPLGGTLVVSSRASYEIIQKAATAGIPAVVAVSAPSSLAVETARALGMTLYAFARDRGVNRYTPGPGAAG